MRASSRSCDSLVALFVAIGTSALLVLIVVLITGGFVVNIGPLRLTALRWYRPLAFALIAWTLAAGIGRRRGLANAASAVAPWLDRYAVAGAIAISTAAAGAGVAFGTHAASASDAAAYVSQAELLASARVARDEPLARQVNWPDATWAFSTLGYRPGPAPGVLVPTYPPGLPLVMAAARIGGEGGPFLVVPLFGALAVFCSFALGARLHSRTAGLVAAALLSTSPVFLFQLVQPMSDVAAMAMWALALRLALAHRSGAVIASGSVAGLALLTRPNLLPLAFVVALVAVGWKQAPRMHLRSTRATLWRLVLGATPVIVVLLFLQWHSYGNPFTSGHGSPGEFFSLANVWPNLRDYALRLLKGEAPALVLACASLLTLALAARRRPMDPQGRSVAGAMYPAGAMTAALLLCYLPYGVFPDWSYLRFFLPTFPLAFVVVGAWLANAVSTLPRATRGLWLLISVTIACSVNVQIAKAEQALNLWRYEARYRSAGRYLEASLPASAVVITVQESASVYHYTHRPVIRWDLLRVHLDEAIATLEALGRTPVLLVEDWEGADLRARFPASHFAGLDWQPRADIGRETRVRLFDPRDRGRPFGAFVTDRFE